VGCAMRAALYVHLFLFLSLISLVFFTLDKANFLLLPKAAAYFMTNPISFGLYQSAQNVGKQFHFITAARISVLESKAAEEQIAQLLSENANLRNQLAETQALVEQQQSLDPKTYKVMPARPIGLDRYLKIDKGSLDGVKVGQAVVYKDNYIGKVVTVSEKSANIQLLADPDSKVAAFSLGKDGKAKGILMGQFGLELLMDKVLHEEKVNPDDLVYSEGTEGFLPRGLVLGKVTQILENQNEVFKQAKVKSLFDIRDLELVFLIQE
jgi:rod shape-determining protein MreC